MKTLTAVLLVAAQWSVVWSQPFPSDEVIRSILRARVDTFKQSVGMVVGLIDESGTRVIGYGRSRIDGGHAVNGGTIYEIGSISKVFTSIVLADMVRRGEVKLTDPVSRYLPDGVQLPTRGEREITLQDLATHRSGLPRMPDDLVVEMDAATDSYSVDRMLDYLSRCSLIDEIGARYYYSNLGFGLLAESLSRRAGQNFEQLLVNRICEPLGLGDTRVDLDAGQRDRKAGTYGWRLEPTPELLIEGMAGAGALRSNARDLLRFLAANIGLIDSDLWASAQFSHLKRKPAGENAEIGLGWHVVFRGGRRLVVHGGGTYGNVSFAGFDREGQRGVVVLSNARGMIQDIGFHLLDSTFRLARFDEAEDPPHPVVLPVAKLRRMVGEYTLGANSIFMVSLVDGELYGASNDGLRFPLKAASDHELFTELSPSVMEFSEFEDDRAQEVTFRYLGHEMSADRIEDYHFAPNRIDLKDQNLDRYAGAYLMDGGPPLTIRERDGVLTVQAEGQGELSLVPTEGGYYSASARAEIVFQEAGSGEIQGILLKQNGEHRGVRY